jgi:transposase-like protein
MEQGLEQEMTEYLGLSRYEHASERHDYRNGHYVRHFDGDGRFGPFGAEKPQGEVSHQTL